MDKVQNIVYKIFQVLNFKTKNFSNYAVALTFPNCVHLRICNGMAGKIVVQLCDSS